MLDDDDNDEDDDDKNGGKKNNMKGNFNSNNSNTPFTKQEVHNITKLKNR